MWAAKSLCIHSVPWTVFGVNISILPSGENKNLKCGGGGREKGKQMWFPDLSEMLKKNGWC